MIRSLIIGLAPLTNECNRRNGLITAYSRNTISFYKRKYTFYERKSETHVQPRHSFPETSHNVIGGVARYHHLQQGQLTSCFTKMRFGEQKPPDDQEANTFLTITYNINYR